jgi:hypothetical protein
MLRDGTISILREVPYWCSIQLGESPGKALLSAHPKQEKSKREIMLPGLPVPALEKQRVIQQEMRERAGERRAEHNIVCCNACGGFPGDNTTRGAFYRSLKKAGLPEIRIHDLGHTASTLFQIDLDNQKNWCRNSWGMKMLR